MAVYSVSLLHYTIKNINNHWLDLERIWLEKLIHKIDEARNVRQLVTCTSIPPDTENVIKDKKNLSHVN